MARPEHPLPDLRATVPTLEPDDAFLARLSELAAGSGTSRPPAGDPSQPGWRVGLAAASVAALVGGVAWIATTVTGDESPPPPVDPVTQPTDGSPDSTQETGPQGVPTGRNQSGAGHDGTTERRLGPEWCLRGLRRLGAGRRPGTGHRGSARRPGPAGSTAEPAGSTRSAAGPAGPGVARSLGRGPGAAGRQRRRGAGPGRATARPGKQTNGTVRTTGRDGQKGHG